ncbi:MAG: hypothetical protein ABI761_11650 [Saprospiraceae bacterium]
MKKLLYINIFLLLGITQHAFAQGKIGNLQGIYYQAVAIDDIGKEIVGTDITGKPLYNKTIGVRFTITKGLNGAVEWAETHTTTTDKYGLFTLIIGKGTKTGTNPYERMLDIPWIDADQFLKVELSIKNDGNFKVVSNQQFMTVPYSFYTDDIADSSITTYKIVDSAILNQDVHTSAIDSRTLLDSTILNQDIHLGAVDSRTLLDSTILNQDIHLGAVDSRTLLDSTILNQDIHLGAVDSRTLLDSTILNEDIHLGAVDSRTILDSSIVNQDIQSNAINSRVILNGSILSEDIADSTIDLSSKVTGTLSVTHGGTGTDSLALNSLLIGSNKGALRSLGQATDGQIPVGVTDSLPKLKVLAGAGGISVSFTADSVIISTGISGIYSANLGTIDPGTISFRSNWLSPPIPLQGVNLGNIVIGSIAVDLDGCQVTAFVSEPNMIRVSIYNGTGNNITLGTGLAFRVMVVQ